MKKFLSSVLAISTLAACLVFTQCENLENTPPIEKPDPATSLKWEFDAETGTLTVSGEGGVPAENTPWAEHMGQIVNVEIEEGITYIEPRAFLPSYENNYGKIKTVEIAGSVASIGKEAFSGCQLLESVTLGEGTVGFGENAFAHCAALTNIVIPSTLTNIGDGAFLNCSALESFVIPNHINDLGSGIFYNCTGLVSVSIPNNLIMIPPGTFHGCTSLAEITIPVEIISQDAFKGCTGLKRATIGSGITHIDSGAFEDCVALADVYIMATTPPEVHANNFIYNSNDRLHVPKGCLEAYRNFESVHFTNVVEQ